MIFVAIIIVCFIWILEFFVLITIEAIQLNLLRRKYNVRDNRSRKTGNQFTSELNGHRKDSIGISERTSVPLPSNPEPRKNSKRFRGIFKTLRRK